MFDTTEAPLIAYAHACILEGLRLLPGGEHLRELGPTRSMLASDIAVGAFVSPPIFPDDGDRHKTVRLLCAMAIRETSVRNDVHGAQGECSLFQIKPAFLGLTCKALEKDAQLATLTALRIIAISQRDCPSSILANYAGGETGCSAKLARAITDDRVRLANDIDTVLRSKSDTSSP
jgi:hypothetical protein